MSHILTLEVSESVFRVLQQQADILGVLPEDLITQLVEQKFELALNPSPTMGLQEMPDQGRPDSIGHSNFERHFGTLHLTHEPSLDNEAIDADLAQKYTRPINVAAYILAIAFAAPA